MDVDAIVNSANESFLLMGGDGVDGAIHRNCRSEIAQRIPYIRRVQTGPAKITNCYNLKAKFVIHTVGPVWRDGSTGEPQLLASC